MSSNSTSKYPLSLLNLFVFNSTYGPKEGEEIKKILYYYPENTDLDTKIKNVGLCEAIIKFVATFHPNKPCEAVHTKKTRQLFIQPEDDFWIVMTTSIPDLTFSRAARDGQYRGYPADEIQDHVFQALLKTIYRTFRLLKGTFVSILEKADGNVEHLKLALNQFFRTYISSFKITQADLLEVFQGVRFLPLERSAFLKIQCFVNLIEANFSQVKYTVFLYNDQLVWSGLEQDDMQILYRYLTVSIFPAFLEAELAGVFSPTRYSAMGTGMHFGRFMTRPKSSADEATVENVPRIFLSSRGQEECLFLVYRALSATVCLLIDGTYHLTLDFFKQLDCFLGPQLSTLASEVGEQYSKTICSTTVEPQIKYLYMYFNHMNLAQKSTIHSDMKKTGHVNVPPEVMKLLADINLDLTRLCDTGEVIGKTENDCWIVGKRSDQREFYVVLQQKNANIVDVNEEVKRLSAGHFQNIFILD